MMDRGLDGALASMVANLHLLVYPVEGPVQDLDMNDHENSDVT